jgi:hypothetical protein
MNDPRNIVTAIEDDGAYAPLHLVEITVFELR